MVPPLYIGKGPCFYSTCGPTGYLLVVNKPPTAAFHISIILRVPLRMVHLVLSTLLIPPFLTISLCRAGLYFSYSVFSIVVPCIQSVGVSSRLPLCCPSISFPVALCSFSQKILVLAISHRCGCVLVSSSSQTTLVFCFPRRFQQVLCEHPS